MEGNDTSESWEQPDTEQDEPSVYRTVRFTFHDGKTTDLINMPSTVPQLLAEAAKNRNWYQGEIFGINLKYVRYIMVVETYDVKRDPWTPPNSQDLR